MSNSRSKILSLSPPPRSAGEIKAQKKALAMPDLRHEVDLKLQILRNRNISGQERREIAVELGEIGCLHNGNIRKDILRGLIHAADTDLDPYVRLASESAVQKISGKLQRSPRSLIREIRRELTFGSVA